MKHIIEALIQDIPVYIREDYPRFVEALRVYYASMVGEGRPLTALWGHDARLDVDRDGLLKAIGHLGLDDVPLDYRRDFLDIQDDYFSKQGSRQGIVDYFRIFHGQPAYIEDTGKNVFEPSAARRETYDFTYAKSSHDLTAPGVIATPETGGEGDVVSAISLSPSAPKIYAIVFSSRRPKPLKPGQAVYKSDQRAIKPDVLGVSVPTGMDGHGYDIGDWFRIRDALGEVTLTVESLRPVKLLDIRVVEPGQGYKVSDPIAISGARGWRAEIAGVNTSGGVESIRVLSVGDGVTRADEFIVSSKNGSGVVLKALQPLGIVKTFVTPRPLVPGFEVVDASTQGTSRQVVSEIVGSVEVSRRTTFNGVIGVGSTLTDSAVWQHGSYQISVPRPVAEWEGGLMRWHHRGGRVVRTLESVRSDITIHTPGVDASTLYSSRLPAVLGGGEGISATLDSYFPLKVRPQTGESMVASLETDRRLAVEFYEGVEQTSTLMRYPGFELTLSTGEESEGDLE